MADNVQPYQFELRLKSCRCTGKELVTDARKIQMVKTKKEMTETAKSATVPGARVDVA